MEPISVALASWELPKIAAPLLGSILKQGGDRLIQSLHKTDIEKAIESGEKAVKEWEKTLSFSDLLFYCAKPDGWNGFNKFLNQYFHHPTVCLLYTSDAADD